MMQAITDMNIQYEDKELLVVYKPAGLATQSARVTSPDLVSSVTRHLRVLLFMWYTGWISR